MIPLGPKMLGVTVGLLAAGAVLSIVTLRMPGRPATGPLLADCEGALREIVVQYVAGAGFAVPVYRQFLGQLPAGVVVHVMCPDQTAYQELAAGIGPVACTLRPILCGHAMTAWSRDRWLCRAPTKPGLPATLLLPHGEDGAELWPARAGDQRVGWDLAGASGGRIAAESSPLFFDGGDFVADERTAFVATNVIRRNLQRTVANIDELRRRLEAALGKRVVLLEDSPEHHAGMFMMAAGGGTVLVGDPSLARSAAHPDLPGGADFSPGTQRRFDSVARQVEEAGYRVMRVPIVPGADGKTFLTWLNVILDQRDGRRIVYTPVYEGCDELNERARVIWRGVGYEVRDVDCTGIFREFGCLRCLVNVVERG